MIRTMLILCLWHTGIWAEIPEHLRSYFSRENQTSLNTFMQQAEQNGISHQWLENKIAEGVLKEVPQVTILKAVEARLLNLKLLNQKKGEREKTLDHLLFESEKGPETSSPRAKAKPIPPVIKHQDPAQKSIPKLSPKPEKMAPSPNASKKVSNGSKPPNSLSINSSGGKIQEKSLEKAEKLNIKQEKRQEKLEDKLEKRLEKLDKKLEEKQNKSGKF